jgi:PAS domain S-box-containing protein
MRKALMLEVPPELGAEARGPVPVRPVDPSRFTRPAARLGLAAAAVGAAGLASRLAPTSLQDALASLGPVHPASSLGILLAGLSFVALHAPASRRPLRWAGLAAAAGAAALGVASLVSDLIGSGVPTMSVPGAIALVLAGTALLHAASLRAGRARPAEALAGGVAVIGLLALLGNLYRVEDLYQIGRVPMAPWTAAGLCLLGVAGLVARSDFGLARVLAGRSVGAAHLRRALPALLGIPLGAGLAAMGGVRLGLWDRGTAFAVFTLVSMAALGGVGALHARRIDALVRERRRLEHLFRRIFENAAVGIAHLDGAGRWLHVNDRLCEIIGWPREELLAAGAPTVPVELLATAFDPTYFELCFPTKEGRPVWVEVAVSPDRDGSPAAENWIAIVTDVTPRKRAEAELQLAQRALACSSDSVIVAAAEPPDGRIVYVNPAFTRITGHEAEEALGQGWSFLGEGAGAQAELGELCGEMQRDESVSVLVRSRRKSGEPLWSELRIAPVVDSQSGAVTHHVGIQEDVTERLGLAAERERLLAEAVEARAEAERAGRAKDEFFALISHELRSPLGAITGWLAVLRRDTPPEVQARALDVVERNSTLLTRLIGDLLDASRIASGKLEIERVPFDLLEVARAAVTALEPAARDREIDLRLEAGDEPAYVEGDPERLDQIVRNLVGNALKFTPPGGRIDVVLRRELDTLVLEVEDTGEGIPADVLPHVFERFQQGDGGTRGVGRGLGLGLSIVRHLVELHGGEVEAASAGSGLGSKFSVRLPAAGRPRTLAASRSKSGPDALEGLCVLLLAADRIAAEGWAMALEAADAEVAWVTSAAQALAQKDSLKPHVLVADIDDHASEAAELLCELRAAKPGEGRLVAAVAVSTLGTLESRRGARDAGFEGYLTRPFQPAQLVALVRSLVSRPTRVLVVDDDADTADSLALLLSRRGFDVERAGDAAAALGTFERFRPDVVLADLQLGADSGVELALSLRARGGNLRIIAASGRAREELGSEAGLFDAFVRKPIELDALLSLLGPRP